MFWGLIMEPSKRYTQTVEKPFHVSQAALDTCTGDNDRCQVMVVSDEKNFLICTLQKGKTIQVPLDLYFKTGDVISFMTNGKCNIHLTGYLDPEFEDMESDLEEESEEEEAPVLTKPKKEKRKTENNTESPPTKKLKNETAKGSESAEDSSDDDEDDEEDENGLEKLLDEDLDSDENDESFKLNSTGGSTNSDEEDEDDDDDEEESIEEESANESDAKEESPKVTPVPMTKSQRKKMRAKNNTSVEQPIQNGISNKNKPNNEIKKAANESKKQKKDLNQKKEQEKKPQMQKKDQVKKSEGQKSVPLSGGVVIEEIQVGSGPEAKPGKMVQVYYEGRLQQNNKMFDNCLKGPGFRFRLGSKEVIQGWDIGVAGMKVGGKRKIVCPPATAYGTKGSPPVIPPNASLVFEVELKNVK